MKKQFDPSWQEWIEINVARGCDKDGMAKILLENDFYPLLIVSELKHLPQSPELIVLMNAKLAEEPAIQSTNDEQLQAFQALDDVHLPGAARVQTDKAHLYLWTISSPVKSAIKSCSAFKNLAAHQRLPCHWQPINISAPAKLAN